MLKTVCVSVWGPGSLQLCRSRSREEAWIFLLLLALPLSFTYFHHLLLRLYSSLGFLCLRPRGFGFRSRRKKFLEPRPVQILLEFHLERWQPEQEGPDPARGAQVCGFLLVLRLHFLLSSCCSSSTPCRAGPVTLAEVLGLLSGSLGWRWICGSVDRCRTRLRSLRAGSLHREAFAEVERQRLLGGRSHGGAGRLGAQVLGQSLRQSAGEGLELCRAQTSPHQLAHLNAAVQVQRQDPQRGQRRPGGPGVPTASSLGSLVHVAPRAAVVLRVERVWMRLKLVPAGMRRIRTPTLGLERVDGRMVLGRVLRRQSRALQASLEADAVPEHIQRTHTFDGAEAAQRASNEVSRQSGDEHTRSRSHRLPSVRLQLLRFGLEGEEGGGHGGELGGEGHVDGGDGRLDGLQRRRERKGTNSVWSAQLALNDLLIILWHNPDPPEDWSFYVTYAAEIDWDDRRQGNCAVLMTGQINVLQESLNLGTTCADKMWSCLQLHTRVITLYWRSVESSFIQQRRKVCLVSLRFSFLVLINFERIFGGWWQKHQYGDI